MQRWFQVSNITFAARAALPRQSHLALVLDIWVYLVSCARPKSRKRLAARTVTGKTQVRHEPNCWTRTTNFTAKKIEMLALRGNQIYSGIESCFFKNSKNESTFVQASEIVFIQKGSFLAELFCTDGPCEPLRLKASLSSGPCSAMF